MTESIENMPETCIHEVIEDFDDQFPETDGVAIQTEPMVNPPMETVEVPVAPKVNILVTPENITEAKYNELRVFAAQNGIKTKNRSPTRSVLMSAIKRFWNKGQNPTPAIAVRGRGRPPLLSDDDFSKIWKAHPNDLTGVVTALKERGIKSKMGLEAYASARAHALRAYGVCTAFRRGRKPLPIEPAKV